jgi:hypothetical protein
MNTQMNTQRPSRPTVLLFPALLLSLLLIPGVLRAAPASGPAATAAGQATAANQPTFPTPEAALQALVAASQASDHETLLKLFGPEGDKLFSGDRVQDDAHLERFAAGLEHSAQLQKDDDGKYTVLVGENHWPFPIPIVSREGNWMFDTNAGIEEILNRRIGQNELAAIATSRAYVVAQWEYYTESGADTNGLAVYARKFISSPGHHDGLYWETAEDEKPSPLGELVAAARAEGYGPQNRAKQPAGQPRQRNPYHGYFFKILTSQGPSAPGGKFSYIINGNMIAGYALVAYPSKWGNSGVMTFIVSQQGRVYQKNLGPATDKIAAAMTEYNPDPTWQLVEP